MNTNEKIRVAIRDLNEGDQYHLDLSSMGLTDDDLSRVGNMLVGASVVHSVSLANNNLKTGRSLSFFLDHFGHLRHLDLSGNGFTCLERLRSVSRKVSEIDLSNNSIKRISLEYIEKMSDSIYLLHQNCISNVSELENFSFFRGLDNQKVSPEELHKRLVDMTEKLSSTQQDFRETSQQAHEILQNQSQLLSVFQESSSQNFREVLSQMQEVTTSLLEYHTAYGKASDQRMLFIEEQLQLSLNMGVEASKQQSQSMKMLADGLESLASADISLAKAIASTKESALKTALVSGVAIPVLTGVVWYILKLWGLA